MTEDRGARVFDMPHARVTLTPVGPNVEIEVWPKAGQSAYAVVDPRVAILIAQQLVQLAAAQLAEAQMAADTADTADSTDASDDSGHASDGHAPDNIVDLAARRPPSGGRAG